MQSVIWLQLALKDVHVNNINLFLFFKLPAAFWSGVRLIELTETYARVKVRHTWFNSNPFASIFWAVQGMAAELSTGILVMNEIRRSGHKMSMLVIQNKAVFTKKARGRVTFSCDAKDQVKKAVEAAVSTGEGVQFWLQSSGLDQSNDTVSSFDFQWSIKLK